MDKEVAAGGWKGAHAQIIKSCRSLCDEIRKNNKATFIGTIINGTQYIRRSSYSVISKRVNAEKYRNSINGKYRLVHPQLSAIGILVDDVPRSDAENQGQNGAFQALEKVFRLGTWNITRDITDDAANLYQKQKDTDVKKIIEQGKALEVLDYGKMIEAQDTTPSVAVMAGGRAR